MTKNIIFFANTSWYLHNFQGNLISELVDSGYKVIALTSDSYTKKKNREKSYKEPRNKFERK